MISLKSASTMEDLIALAASHADAFDCISDCVATQRCLAIAKGRRATKSEITFVCDRAEAWLSRPASSRGKESRNSTQLLYSLAKVGTSPTLGVVTRMIKEAIAGASTFNSMSAANALWAVATMHIEDAAACRQLAEAAARLSPAMNPQELNNTVWSLTVLGIKDEAIFQAPHPAAQGGLECDLGAGHAAPQSAHFCLPIRRGDGAPSPRVQCTRCGHESVGDGHAGRG